MSTEEWGRILTDPAAYADPTDWHRVAREMRDAGPIHRITLPGRDPFWAVMGHPEVMEVEKNWDVFTNSPTPNYHPTRQDPDEPSDPPAVYTLIQMDGDDHKVHRGLVNDWFKPSAVRLLTDKVEALATRSIDEMAAMGGSCDFAADIAMYFPLRVILSVLGLPEEDFPRLLRLTQELFGSEDPDFVRNAVESDADNAKVLAVITDIIGYFSGVTADRRAAARDDFASVIANAKIDGRPLNDMETFGYYLITATAGHDTTSSAIAGGLQVLLQHPEQLQRLRDDPSLIDNAADEIVRWVSPVKHFMRTARADYDLAGTPIARKDWLMLSYPSANFDARVFDDPFRFDIGRQGADRHLGFGFGRHYCLGAHLARLEIRVIFRELLRRVAHIELAGDAAQMHSIIVSGPKRLPIRYRMAA